MKMPFQAERTGNVDTTTRANLIRQRQPFFAFLQCRLALGFVGAERIAPGADLGNDNIRRLCCGGIRLYRKPNASDLCARFDQSHKGGAARSVANVSDHPGGWNSFNASACFCLVFQGQHG